MVNCQEAEIWVPSAKPKCCDNKKKKQLPPYIQNGCLPCIVNPQTGGQILLIDEIPINKIQSVDVWLRRDNGMWVPPGNINYLFSYQILPGPHGGSFFLILPSNTTFHQGTPYTIKIFFD